MVTTFGAPLYVETELVQATVINGCVLIRATTAWANGSQGGGQSPAHCYDIASASSTEGMEAAGLF